MALVVMTCEALADFDHLDRLKSIRESTDLETCLVDQKMGTVTVRMNGNGLPPEDIYVKVRIIRTDLDQFSLSYSVL